MKTGFLILMCCYFLWRLRLVRLRLSNWAISPTLITLLLGFAVIVAHLSIAKWLWGFPWADVAMGFPVVAVVALDFGYFYVRSRQLSLPKRDPEIVETFFEPGGTDPLVGGKPGRAGLPVSQGARDREWRSIGDSGIVETSLEGTQPAAYFPRWPRCKSLGIPIPPCMAQNRCSRTQKKHPAQLPNTRF